MQKNSNDNFELSKKEIRKLLSIAYERELNTSLSELYQHFKNWENKNIDCHELSQHIHKFYTGDSRGLFKLYNYCYNKKMLIIKLLVKNILIYDDLPENAKKNYKKTVEKYKNYFDE